MTTVTVLQLIELATKTQGGISRKELAETIGCNPNRLRGVRRLLKDRLIHYDNEHEEGPRLVAGPFVPTPR